MAKNQDTAPHEGDYMMVDPTAVQEPHRNPPLVRVHGRGSCDFNTSAVHLIKEICAQAGLVTRTPWGVALAQDPKSGNPVLFMSQDQIAQGVSFNWHDGGRRAAMYLADGFKAWKITIAARRGTSFSIPLELTTQPSTGQPGLMLRADQITSHVGVPRKPRKAKAGTPQGGM